MIVELTFRYEIDEDTVEEWAEEWKGRGTTDAYVQQRAVELSTDLLADWLIDGGQPELGVNAEIVED